MSQPSPSASAATATSHQPAAPPTTTDTVIEPVQFRGRTISSLRRPVDGNHYVLLDAVCRVFFPGQRNVAGFIRAADTLFHIPDWRMSEAEQRHFIRFYKLPTDRLTHDRLIRLDLLTDLFPSLERLFSCSSGSTEGQDTAGQSVIGAVIPRPTTPGQSVIGAVLRRPTTSRDAMMTNLHALTQTTTTTTTNNNNNDDKSSEEVVRPRKRRRPDACADVVVID